MLCYFKQEGVGYVDIYPQLVFAILVYSLDHIWLAILKFFDG